MSQICVFKSFYAKIEGMKLIILSFILFAINSLADTDKPLQFALIHDTPDQMIGAEVLKVAYKRLGIPIKIISMPGKRALIQSSNGRLDGEVHRIFEIGFSYPNLIRVPTPINFIEPTVFSIKKFTVTDCAGLKDYHIGRVRGIRHVELCTRDMKKIKVVNHSYELMQVLNDREVDIAITARLNGVLQIKKLGFTKVHALTPALGREPLYHYVHKKNRALVPIVNKVLIEMKESGELEQIREIVVKRMEKEAELF